MANPIVQYILKMDDQASPGLKSVGESADKTSDQAEKTKQRFENLKKAGAALGKALLTTVTAFVAFNQKLADNVNALIDMETRTGIASGTLAGLSLAAEGSGQSLEAMERVLVALPGRLADAARGTGTAADALAKLSIDVTDAQGNLRDADTVFREIIASMMAIPEPTERAAVATQIFGQQGTRLLQALGGAELQTFIDLADQFGTDIGPAAARAANKWQRAMAEMKTVTAGLADDLAQALGSGGAGEIVHQFTTGVTIAFTFMSKMIELNMDRIKGLIGGFQGLWQAETAGEFRAAMSEISAAGGISTLIGGGLPTLAEDVRAAVDAAVEAGTELDQMFTKITSGAGGAGGAGGGPVGGGALEDIAEAGKEITFVLGEARLEAITLADTFDLLSEPATEGIAALGDKAGGLRDRLADLAEEIHGPVLSAMDELNSLQADATIALTRGQIGAEEYAAALDDIAIAMANLQQSQSGMQNFIETGTLSMMAGGLTGDVSGVIGAGESALSAAGLLAPGVGTALTTAISTLETIGSQGVDAIVGKVDDFADNVAAGFEALPDLIPALVESLTEAIPQLVSALVEAAPQIVVAILKGTLELVKFVLLELPALFLVVIRDAVDAFWGDMIRQFVDMFSFGAEGTAGEFFTGASAGRIGLAIATAGMSEVFGAAGKGIGLFQEGGMVARTQLAVVHQGERIIQAGGAATQAGRAMAGGGGVTININAAAIDRDAIPSLVRSIERAYGQFGRATSPLFAG